MPNNFNQDLSLKQQGGTRKAFKKMSFALVCLVTLLLILDIIDVKLIFGKTETGLWDNMPDFARKGMFLGYPVLLVVSYIIFICTIKIKTKFDAIANMLFILNGIAVVLLFTIFLIELTKNV